MPCAASTCSGLSAATDSTGIGALVGYAAGQAIRRTVRACEWEGFRFYDLIFPLFLFLVGVVLPFSLRKYQSGEQPKSAAFGRIARRVVLLFLLGLVYNNVLQFRFENQRYTGVLQRIAICYGIAAVIFLLTKVRTQVILFVAILLGYWAILMFVPSPESKAGDFTRETNLAGYLDRHYLPGKINQGYYGFGDNEGLLSTIPAVATALAGGAGGSVADSKPRSLDQGRRPGAGRARLPWPGHAGEQSLSGHQDPLDQHVRSGCGRLEFALAGALLHDHRRHRSARLGFLLRRDRRQCDHHLRGVANHSL